MKHFKNTIVIGLVTFGISLISFPAAFGGKVYIPQGTEIQAKFKADITTETGMKPSGMEILEVAADQKISGIGVIRQGDKVFCEVIKFKKPGLLGGGGAIEVKIDSIQTALGKNIKTESKTLTAIGKSKRLKAILMLPVLGYGILIKGDHAELGKQNGTVTLKTSELELITF